jgi:TPR repeat protein
MRTYFNFGMIMISCLSFTQANSSSTASKHITPSKSSISPSDSFELAYQHHRIGEFKEAFKYATIAANAKNKKAQALLAYMYLNGEGVEQSDSKAKYFYQLSADQGYAPAQARLGFMHQDDSGGRIPDLIQAFKYFKLSADNGDGDAQSIVALWYLRGKATKQNYAEALKYAKLAAKKNIPEAYGLLGLMYENGMGVSPDNNLATRYYKLEASYKKQ